MHFCVSLLFHLFCPPSLLFFGSVRVPVRLYVWNVTEDFEDLEDAPPIDSWDKISYINRPVEILKEDGKCFIALLG